MLCPLLHNLKMNKSNLNQWTKTNEHRNNEDKVVQKFKKGFF